ncbi:MAG: hypothetical protein E7254_07445 [Lachnospiraceae bacterium]|nr:hypothetical protein [Lachnospiraceae bacterium]
MEREKIKQCLMDTGCHEEASDNILKQFESESMEDVLRLLKKERCRLMDEYHESGRKIDCIDFMLRELEKEMKTKNGGV